MKDKPLVSIITVSLNSEKTIERTIKSVINQTYPNIEYIIIDGKSTDGTLDIIDKYKNHISVFVPEKDDGLYYAMNKGIDLATGEIIGIINSDDWYEQDIIGKMVSEFKKNPSLDFAFGNLRFWSAERYMDISPDLSSKASKYRRQIAHPTMFIRKKAYEQVGGYNTKYSIAADTDLILKLNIGGYKHFYLNEIVTNMTLGGISGKKRTRSVIEDFIIHWTVYNNAYDRLFLLILYSKILIGVVILRILKKITDSTHTYYLIELIRKNRIFKGRNQWQFK